MSAVTAVSGADTPVQCLACSNRLHNWGPCCFHCLETSRDVTDIHSFSVGDSDGAVSHAQNKNITTSKKQLEISCQIFNKYFHSGNPPYAEFIRSFHKTARSSSSCRIHKRAFSVINFGLCTHNHIVFPQGFSILVGTLLTSVVFTELIILHIFYDIAFRNLDYLIWLLWLCHNYDFYAIITIY